MKEKKMPKNIEEKDVFPGDKLAVIEEFSDGKGTFSDDGTIRSSEIGKTDYNIETHIVKVEKKTPELIIPEEGMTVIANVASVSRRDARINIFMLNDKRIYPSYSGVVHISDISSQYTKNIDMAIRNNDVVKAKLVNTKNHLNQCTLAGEENGVIYAYCRRCGGVLEKERGKLICPDCGRVERRKMARSYGEEDLT
jgi:exosome complex component CSL4